MSTYPGAVDSFPDRADGDPIPSTDHDDLAAAVVATQTELGTDPSGAAATVAARLDAVDTALAGKLATTAGAVGTANLAGGAVTAAKVAADVATQAELDAAIAALSGSYAPIASPALTGNPTAPTPSPGDNDTSIATTAFVKAATDAAAPLIGSVVVSGTPSAGRAPLATSATTAAWGDLVLNDGRTYATAYGVVADCRTIEDGVVNGTTTFTSATANFTAGDVGKPIVICNGNGTAGNHHYTTIATRVSATTVTLSVAASATASGLFFTYGTDNTTAMQAAINAVVEHGTLMLPPSPVLVTDTLNVNKAMNIEGVHHKGGQWGAYGVNGYGTLNGPSVAPILTGAVLVMAAANKDCLVMNLPAGSSNQLKNFGVFFAGFFNNTGHGIYAKAPGSPRENGLLGALWQNLQVFGAGGTKYAFLVENPLNNTFIHLLAWGAGGLCIDGSSTVNAANAFGNNQIMGLYVQLVAGSAHGIYVNTCQLNTFIRPQSFTGNIPTNMVKYVPAGGHTGDGYRSNGLGPNGAPNYHVHPNYESPRNTFLINDVLTNGGLINASNYDQVTGLYHQSTWQNSLLLSNGDVLQPKTYTRTTRRSPVQVGVGAQSFQAETSRPIWSDGYDWRYGDNTVAFIAAASAGAGTAPGSIAGGPSEWWAADALGLADGAKVSTWASTGTGAHALTQGTAGKQPTFKTNMLAGTKPAVRFDAAHSLAATYTRSQPQTVVIVVKLNGLGYKSPFSVIQPTNDQSIFDGVTNSCRISPFVPTPLGVGAPGQYYMNGGADILFTGATLPIVDQWGVFSGVFNGASSLLRWNGGTFTVSGNAGTAAPGGFTLGALRGETSKFLRGDVAEVLTYDSALSTANLLEVERWLGTKYGLAVI